MILRSNLKHCKSIISVRPSVGLLLFVCLLLSSCANLSPRSSLGEPSEEEVQVRKRIDEVFDAVHKKDLERLDSYHLYGPKFTKFTSETPGRMDADAARRGEHEGVLGAQDIVMHAEDLKVDLFGRVAIATFTFKYSFRAGADTVGRQALATLVFVKDHGSWKITHEHFTRLRVIP